MDHFSGKHNWYCHTMIDYWLSYCNVCREAMSGVTSLGLSCEVCKFKAHKRCAVHVTSNCKWTTLASIGKDIIEDEEGISMPHQWLEGNLPIRAKCTICDKTCGSILRLQDWRCIWCKAMVHTRCKEQLSSKCPLGKCKVSIIPPTAINSIDSDGFWKASCPPSCARPLLVFVNSKSGGNRGVKFLRRFKQLMNPAQVFDLGNGGPHLGLRLFQKLDTFGILVCGGDGSVSWVLSEMDTLTLHKQCQLGVLPLGTGNDLARVLGWRSACDDDKKVPQILEKLGGASITMLDRWSIMVYDTKFPQQHSASVVTEDCSTENMECYTEKFVMNNYFGIGLDAKISLDFNNKRNKHPEKFRSRAQNRMCYGVLAISELLQRTYRNLEQRVILECDGRPIPLPSLQGIVVLNISSYAGGTNFWGGTKKNNTFAAPSSDDKVLEVVAVFGIMQMAVSRVINLQYHRIAQCCTVRITILGDESIPVQVDGEGWLQPPGFIQIIHKNQTQTLTRVSESVLQRLLKNCCS